MSQQWKSILLGTEYVLLFFGIPLVMFLVKRFPLPSILLIPILVFIILILRFRTDFRWKELVYLGISRRQLARDGIILLASALCLTGWVLVLLPGRFLNLPKGNPLIWIAICTFYPVFSAYPQEIIYRTFIFRRYGGLFRGKWILIAASGISFSFAHILYYHPISMILTLVAGIYLASTFARTRSVLYSAILHAVLGVIVFTVGMGEYFWLNMYDYL